MIVPLKALEDILVEYIRNSDFNEFSEIVGNTLGGECSYIGQNESGDELFKFTPNENYTGDLNNFPDSN